MKISKVILTLFIILIILGVISLIFPKNNLQIGQMDFKFPSLKEMFFEEKPQYADINSILEEKDKNTSLQNNTFTVKVKKNNVIDIELPENNSRYLDNFFACLDSISTNDSKVRIIHYGDSQIEGDRITSYLRSRLQKQFGGIGAGEIPLHSLSTIKNITFTYSDNWNFYSIIDTKANNTHHYGLMQSFVKTVTDKNSLLQADTSTISSANITISSQKIIKTPITLYFHTEKGVVKVFDKNNLLVRQNTYQSENNQLQNKSHSAINTLSIPIKNNIKTFTIQTEGDCELYSLDFSENKGVYVDNVSLRGSAGYGFTKNNADFLSEMSRMLNVKLIILQFGVNAVPQDEQEIMASYDFYKIKLVKQIRFLKKTNPNAAIIVVGISDRSRKKGNYYETNPNIPMILAAQKQAAKESGVAFWNLFDAMGGENSMPSWVLREKPLANSDFTHFNAAGAKYVGELFYMALENAYNNYKQR